MALRSKILVLFKDSETLFILFALFIMMWHFVQYFTLCKTYHSVQHAVSDTLYSTYHTAVHYGSTRCTACVTLYSTCRNVQHVLFCRARVVL